jgi:AcrR family transcriptional regulator
METRAKRKSPRGDRSRRQILDSAMRLFSAGGFNPASIADIAADVGITQAGLLHHFPSKGALLLAVLQEREERNERAEQASLDAGVNYLSTFLGTLRANERTPALVQLFAILSAESIASDHPAHDWFTERYRRVIAFITEQITAVFDPDKLPAGMTVETFARWIVAVADGIRLQSLLEPAAVRREQALLQFFDILRPYMRDPRLDIRAAAPDGAAAPAPRSEEAPEPRR